MGKGLGLGLLVPSKQLAEKVVEGRWVFKGERELVVEKGIENSKEGGFVFGGEASKS